MELVWSILLGAVLGAYAVWRLPYKRQLPQPVAPAPEPPAQTEQQSPRPPQQAEPPRTIQTYAELLKAPYEASSHPQELESHPALIAGVELLQDPAVPL